MPGLLCAEELRVSVGGRVVVWDASLAVGAGELVVVIGPNAAGKSSLLYALAGVQRYRVAAGRILFGGEDVTGAPAWARARRGLVLATQFQPTLRYVTGWRVVEAMSRVYGFSMAEAREVLRRLGVEELADRPLFKGFSGGEKRRMELALALLQKPRLLMLDEPDSGVDVDSVKLIADTILSLVAEGRSVLLVSHNVYTLSLLSGKSPDSRTYIMSRGRLCPGPRLAEAAEALRRDGLRGLVESIGC